MKLTVEVEPTPRMLAEVFADWQDEEQAQFFIEVAKIADQWTGMNFNQWHAVGAHLRTCVCSSSGAREIVLNIARGIGPCDLDGKLL